MFELCPVCQLLPALCLCIRVPSVEPEGAPGARRFRHPRWSQSSIPADPLLESLSDVETGSTNVAVPQPEDEIHQQVRDVPELLDGVFAPGTTIWRIRSDRRTGKHVHDDGAWGFNIPTGVDDELHALLEKTFDVLCTSVDLQLIDRCPAHAPSCARIEWPHRLAY